MTPGARVLDLTECKNDLVAAKKVCETAKEWAEIVTHQHPNTDATMVRLLLGEFLKNTLHGDCSLVSIFPLRDGSFLVVSEDEEGQDHIPDDCNGHCGTVIIKTLAGEENYRLYRSPDGHYTGYLRIVPQSIPTS